MACACDRPYRFDSVAIRISGEKMYSNSSIKAIIINAHFFNRYSESTWTISRHSYFMVIVLQHCQNDGRRQLCLQKWWGEYFQRTEIVTVKCGVPITATPPQNTTHSGAQTWYPWTQNGHICSQMNIVFYYQRFSIHSSQEWCEGTDKKNNGAKAVCFKNNCAARRMKRIRHRERHPNMLALNWMSPTHEHKYVWCLQLLLCHLWIRSNPFSFIKTVYIRRIHTAFYCQLVPLNCAFFFYFFFFIAERCVAPSFSRANPDVFTWLLHRAPSFEFVAAFPSASEWFERHSEIFYFLARSCSRTRKICILVEFLCIT